MIHKKLETVSNLMQINKIVKISKEFVLLLISANKDALYSGIQTYFS